MPGLVPSAEAAPGKTHSGFNSPLESVLVMVSVKFLIWVLAAILAGFHFLVLSNKYYES
jgi:hypothetical protein